MASIDITGSFISISESDKTSSKSSIQQLVDIVQADIASTSSTTRKKYEVFVSGGVNLNTIKSSLFQTVYDQDFTLGTSNALFDITIGSLQENNTDGISATVNGISASLDSGGKLTNFTPDVAMMREKVNIYKQFASVLLGDPNAAFVTPHSYVGTPPDSPTSTDPKFIKGAVFICFKRLFTRDNIFKGSFGMNIHKKAALLYQDFIDYSGDNRATGQEMSNISIDPTTNPTDGNSFSTFEDNLVITNLSVDPVAGEVSTLVDSSSEDPVGLIYYDKGIIVLDVERAFDSNQIIRGIIDSTRQNSSTDHASTRKGPFYVYGSVDGTGNASPGVPVNGGYFYPVYTESTGSASTLLTDGTFDLIDAAGNVTVGLTDPHNLYIDLGADSTVVGGAEKPSALPSGERYPLFVPDTSNDYYENAVINDFLAGNGNTLVNAALYPKFWVSGTIDSVLDHICETRFGRTNSSSISFRNETVINSSLIFCRAAPTQFNYSTNPTYSTEDGDIIATNYIESGNSPFSYVTTVGLYDANRQLLAVAKTSRPIEKNPETDLSIRVRLDY